jgi:hypothetical protein
LIKKILNAAYFLIYQRTTEFGTSKETFKNSRLSVKKSLGKESATFLYLDTKSGISRIGIFSLERTGVFLWYSGGIFSKLRSSFKFKKVF